MRLAVISDIHGNLPALEAVLSDLAAQAAPDAVWVLGDLVAFCPWPSETLARLREIPHADFLRGNTDRYLTTGRRPPTPARSPEEWAAMPDILAFRGANFSWTVARLSYDDYRFLADLPERLEMREVPNYGCLLAVHATPTDDETNIYPETPDEEVRRHLENVAARLLLYGHTHRPLERYVGGTLLVNPGSVGLPLDGDPRPSYALLDFNGGDCAVTIRRVPYDREAVIAELERVAHPARAWTEHIIREARPPQN